jgi:hypothetical protein
MRPDHDLLSSLRLYPYRASWSACAILPVGCVNSIPLQMNTLGG